ncbi:sensor histidine kinase [Dermabacteraceae bacterium P13115]
MSTPKTAPAPGKRRRVHLIDALIAVLGCGEMLTLLFISQKMMPGDVYVALSMFTPHGILHLMPDVATSAKIAALLGCLLALALVGKGRHRRWLLPIVLLANLLPNSLVVTSVAVFSGVVNAKRRPGIVGITLLGACVTVANALTVPGQYDVVVVRVAFALLVCGLAGSAGMNMRSRQMLLEQWRERAVNAEENRATHEAQARRAERTRIAREMHDVVAHKISLVALQAGALEVNAGIPRYKVEESAALIRATATSALQELRMVLGVLRQSGDEKPLSPQPTWRDIERLIQESREAGIQVELYDFVDGEVPDLLSRTVYRVVQEALTNIHKHAPRAAARVALVGEPGRDLTVEVSNPLPIGYETQLPGASMGLAGLQARVAHAGGQLHSGVKDNQRFEVKAVIPWPMQPQ